MRMLFIVSKQCACSRRVHIECHMNRFEYCHPDNNSDNDSFGSFLSKNRIFCRKRTLTDSEIKRNRSEVSSKWNKCRIYVGDQLDRCRWMERTQGCAWLLLFPLCWPLKICVCLPHKYGRFMLLIDNNLLLPGTKLHILINIYLKWS
jgi:hypothetical protein